MKVYPDLKSYEARNKFDNWVVTRMSNKLN